MIKVFFIFSSLIPYQLLKQIGRFKSFRGYT
jgi:hypothetical protein